MRLHSDGFGNLAFCKEYAEQQDNLQSSDDTADNQVDKKKARPETCPKIPKSTAKDCSDSNQDEAPVQSRRVKQQFITMAKRPTQQKKASARCRRCTLSVRSLLMEPAAFQPSRRGVLHWHETLWRFLETDSEAHEADANQGTESSEDLQQSAEYRRDARTLHKSSISL